MVAAHALELVPTVFSESVSTEDALKLIAELTKINKDRDLSAHVQVEAPTESTSSTELKPQLKKGSKRAHIFAILESFVERSPSRQRAAAQIEFSAD